MPHEGNNPGQIRAIRQTPLVAGTHVALGVGWGADATVVLADGANDIAGQFTISTLVGGGAMAQATATVVITFTSARAAAPRSVIVTDWNTNDVATFNASKATASTTALTITFGILPVTAKDYTFNYALVG